MTGLSGMSYQNRRGYIRPLLGITRSEIEAHLTECGLSWRDDNSNRDTTFLRNRIRHELLPLLEQYNPSVRASLSTAAAILSAENSLLEAQATQAAGQVCRDTAQGCFCSISRLKSLPLALQRRVLRQTLGRLHGNLEQFSHHHIETICKMAAAARPNMQITLPHGIVAVKEYDQVVFRHEDHSQPQTFKLHLPGPGIYQLPDSQLLTIELSSPPEQPGSDGSSTAYFDLDKIPFPWHIRTFHSGDRLQLLGMHGRKKLKDLFIDNKVPLYQRRRTPLILCEQEIVWVCGLRTSHLARLDGNSTQVAKVVFSRME